jgi:fatty acid desaturase
MCSQLLKVTFEENMSTKLNVNPEIIKKLSEQNALKSLSLIAFDWISIAAVIALSVNYWNPFLYVLAVMIIANRQHGLLILMHDSSHFRFSRNRKLNDIMGEGLTAWPLFIRMKAYREKHLAHHQKANTSEDPDFRPERYPQTRKEILKKVVGDGLAINTLEQLEEIKRLRTKTSTTYQALRIAFYIAVAAGLTAIGGWKIFLMYWVVPSFTWLKVALRLRSVSDHTGVQDREKPFDTRTIVPSLFDKLFLAPHSSSYHLGHHIYAAVPCYNLKKLHYALMEVPEIRAKAHVSNGYHNMLMEFPWDKKDIASHEEKFGLSFSRGYPETGS